MEARVDREAAVAELREFNRLYARLLPALDQPERARTPYSLSEVRVLREVARGGLTDAHRVRGNLGIAASHLSRMLTRFEKQGLAVRERYFGDARHTQVRLTEAGRAAVAELDAHSKQAAADLLRHCNGAQIRNLTEALRTLRLTLVAPSFWPDVRLREPKPGELGWIVHAHGAFYAAEYGWNAHFEALVARIVSDFARGHDPQRERVWIAEVDDRPVGSLMCVRDAEPGTGRLRLLLVDPAVRGHGIGKELLRACVRFACEAGYRELALWTQDVQTTARKICAQAGFEARTEKEHESFGVRLIAQDWRVDPKEANL